jgi:predicted ATPase
LNSRILAEPALVGRERELEELQQHLDLAVQGKGTTVFVSGEAGSGKTRLITEFLLASKQKRDITQLTGWCLSNSGVPYFPFIEAFNVYSSGFGKKDVSPGMRQGGLQPSLETEELVGDGELGLRAWLLGPGKTEKSRELEELSPQAWKDSTFAAVTKALFSISAKKPTILFIDDLHWADTASLALLQYISRFILSQRILVLGTFRIEDLNPDSEGRPHPLLDALRLMGRENLYKQIELPNLRSPDVSLLAENMVGGRVQTELSEKLAVESQGNPLFIVESLKMLSEKGSLVQENERWRLSTDEIGIPTKIKDILLRRIGILKPSQRKILDVASVIGSKFDPELLGAAVSQGSLETLETLNAIEKSTSLVVGEGNIYRFDHAKYRDALYEEISQPLRKAYHGRIAEKIESAGSGAGKLPVGDLAFHYAQAGNKEKAVKYALAAGEEALKIYSGAEAIKHFRYVLDVTAEDVKYTDERTTALEGLGDGLAIRGRNLEAGKAFEQLSNSVTSGSVKMRAMAKAIHSYFAFGDYSRALSLSDKVVEYPDLDRLEYARIRTAKGMVKFWGGKVEESTEDFKESLRVLEEEYLLSDMAKTLCESAPTYWAIGEEEESIAAGLRGVALSEYSRNIEGALESNSYLSVVFLGLKLEKEGLEAASEVVKLVEKVSDPVSRASYQSVSCFMSSQFLEAKASQRLFSGLPLGSMRSFGTGAKIKFFMSSLISGALREFKQTLKTAIAQALKGAELAEETDSYAWRSYNYGNLTRQYAAVGDMEQAEKYYKKLEKVSEEAPMAGGPMGYGGVLLSKAGYFSSKGQWKEANKFFEEAIEVFLGTGAILAGVRQGYCWALLQQGRFADAKLQFEKAKETLDSLDKRFVHSNVLGYFIAPKRVEVNKEFNMRLDLINVAKSSGVLVRVEGVVPANFEVTATQPHYGMQNGSIELEKKSINPFTDEAITFVVRATKAGAFNLNPQLVYVDDLGETKTCKINSVNVTVQPASSQNTRREHNVKRRRRKTT